MYLREALEAIGEVTTENWVSATKNYMRVYWLVNESRDKKAKCVLEGYLRKQVKEGEGIKNLLRTTVVVSTRTAERLCGTIDDIVEIIDNCLK